MRTRPFFAIALAGLALSACAPRYYYDDRYDAGYYGPPPGSYQDRDRYNDPYYDRDGDQVRGHYYDWRDRY
jgi:hypothetical protein